MGELATRIRSKYPGSYDSIPDADLESKIVAKYPGVYDHLVKSDTQYNQYTGGKTPEDARAEFIRQEDNSLKGIARRATDVAMPIVRPLLEGGGALAGGIVGLPFSPATAGLSSIAGGATGYATGKYLADLIESKPQSATQTLSDLGTGAMYEMGGAVAGNLIGQGVSAASKYATKKPLADIAQRRAVDVLKTQSELTPVELANLAKSQKLTNKLGVELTPAQMTGKPSQQSLEQAMATADPEFAAVLNSQDSAAKQAGINQINQLIGKGRPLPLTQDLQLTGANINSQIKTALKPVKEAEREAWAAVPNYKTDTSIVKQAFDDALSQPTTAEADLLKMKDIFNRTDKTVTGLRRLETEITGTMMNPSTDPNTRRELGLIKDAIVGQYGKLADDAASGNIALFKDELVNPAALNETRNILVERLAKANTSTPMDINAMRKEIAATGAHSSKYLSAAGTSPAVAESTLAKNYTEITGKQPIRIASASSEASDISKAISDIDYKLANLSPADDAAAAIQRAKNVTIERVDRFGKGSVKDVLKKGDNISGTRISEESMPRKFFTPSGADGLIKAVGKNAAKEQMKPFVITDIIKTASPDGVNFNVQSATNYINKNRMQLERLGLMDEAKTIIKDQLPKEFEKILAKRAPDAQGKQFFTAQDMRGILQKYGNTIKQSYGAEALNAFRDYNQLMNMIERKNVISRGGGSNTADKAMNIANSMIKESIGPAKKLTDGLILAFAKGATVGGAGGIFTGTSIPTAATIGTLNAGRQLLSNSENQVAKAFVKTLQDATLNPALAKDLMTLQRTGKIPATLQTIIDSNLAGATALTTKE